GAAPQRAGWTRSRPALAGYAGRSLLDRCVLPEQLDELAHPRRMVRPRARGHHHAVDHTRAVDELGTGSDHVGLERRVGRGAASGQDVARGEHERRVAEMRDRLLIAEEVDDDAL